MLRAANFVLRGMRSIPGAIYNVFATKPKPEPLEPPRRVSVRTVRASEADAKALMATDDQATRDSSRRAAQSLPAESGMSAGGDGLRSAADGGKQTRRVSALDGRPMSKEESELMAKIDQYNEHEEKQLHHISRGLRNLRCEHCVLWCECVYVGFVFSFRSECSSQPQHPPTMPNRDPRPNKGY